MARAAAAHGRLTRPADFRGVFRDDREACCAYSESAGIARIEPRAVAVPGDAEDVSALVRWAAAHDIPLVPRGSGSSMGGGAIGTGVIVDLSRMRRLAPVNAALRTVRAEPGVLRDEVSVAANAAALRFPVNPSSGGFCTIGGMAATNASGSHTLRHGSMRKCVRALDCVFADGTRATITRGATRPAGVTLARFDALRSRARGNHPAVRKNSSGYEDGTDLVDLLVGSEGTLAIFTGIELMLTDRPAATSSVLAAFVTLDDATRGAAIAREEGAAACELLDRTFVDIARTGGSAAAAGLPAGTDAALLIEIEADDQNSAKVLAQRLADRLDGAGAALTLLALTPDDEHRLWELRHAASPILARLDPSLKSMQFIEDGAVPPDRLADYVRGVRAALDRVALRGVIFGHAGDAHVHVNPLVDIRLPDWRSRMESLFGEVCDLTIALGGTMSGEHGDGRLRAPVLGAVHGDGALEWARLVKDAFDPLGILNPGVKVPLPGQRPIEQVKYDPALSPLPPRAARALEIVAERRAYSEFRLDLLDAAADVVPGVPSVAPSDPAD